MRSSTTPPSSAQHSVYCACPGAIRSRSAVRQRLTNAAAPGPVTDSLPRWLTSNTPTAVRTAVCSATVPAGYDSGIDQPPKAPSVAPSATCRSCRGLRSSVPSEVSTAGTPPGCGAAAVQRRDRPQRGEDESGGDQPPQRQQQRQQDAQHSA